MKETPSILSGRYRHYKGNEYTVIGVARHSETLEEHVVYRRKYGEVNRVETTGLPPHDDGTL